MYHIAICDDEPIFVKQMSEITAKILSEQGASFEIHEYYSAAELMTALTETSNTFDILILDIILGDINGVKFTEYLRDIGNRIPVIFISSSGDFVFDAYSAEPVGYIMKPIDSEKFKLALNRAIRRLKPPTLVVESPSLTVSFNMQNVVYIEVFGKKLLLHMQDGTVTEISKTLSSVSENLPQDRFVQCHRSFIVALSSILSIRRFEITLKNHTVIPISKYCYNTVQERLQQYAAKWF